VLRSPVLSPYGQAVLLYAARYKRNPATKLEGHFCIVNDNQDCFIYIYSIDRSQALKLTCYLNYAGAVCSVANTDPVGSGPFAGSRYRNFVLDPAPNSDPAIHTTCVMKKVG
jgi:hypothetical protein